MKRIAVVSKNEYLVRKIELTLHGVATVFHTNTHPTEHFDLCLWDLDTQKDAPVSDGIYTMSAYTESDIALPFEFSTLLDIVSEKESGALLVIGERCAYLRGEKIKLTELECALLSRLMSANGEYVSRVDILRDVWGADADAGIINVYIHYLREKLEHGEKIIVSSRSLGYKIDGRYL